MSKTSKRASSQVSWALLTEGVTEARLHVHKIRTLVRRALQMVEQSDAKDHLYQVAGDIIQNLPEVLDDAETTLDRTSYALSAMGREFLRSRLPFEDRHIVDNAIQSNPFAQPKRTKESMESRVARRWIEAQAEGAEGHFFDNPENREVREFYDTEARSNITSVAKGSAKETGTGVRGEVSKSKEAPPTPSKIEREPGGRQFSTLNRFVVETEQPRSGRVPQGHSDIPKAKKI